MARTAAIQVRIEPKTKKQVQRILADLDITLSEAVSMYFKQIVFHNGIPFELKVPNKVTARTIKKLEAGQDLHKTGSVDELFKELES